MGLDDAKIQTIAHAFKMKAAAQNERLAITEVTKQSSGFE
jgi:hypothetical protein